MKPITAEERRIIANHDHRAMILNEQLWPLWPVLPVKNPRREETKENPFNDQGLIYAGRPTVVVLLNLMMAGTWTPQTPEVVYATVDDLVADGWQVD